MVLSQNLVGNIEQGLPRIAVTHPGACIATDPVVLGETGTQQRNAKALRTLRTVRTGHHQLRRRLARRDFQVFQVADLYRLAKYVGKNVGTYR